MKTNKNIDRLFQEKLKDFEVSPPTSVWEGIQSNLHQKNPKSILPLWLKMSGAAAVLLLLTLGGINYFEKNPNEIIITDTNDIENTPTNENGILNPVLNNSNETNSVITDATQNNDSVSETLKIDKTQTEKQLKFNSTNENSQVGEVNSKSENNFSNINNVVEPKNKKSLNSTVTDINQNKLINENTNTKETFNNKILKLNEKEENSNSQIANESRHSNKVLNNPKSNIINNEIESIESINSNSKILNTDSSSAIVNTETNKQKLIKTDTNKNLDNSILNPNSGNDINNTTIAGNRNEIIENKKERFGKKISVENNLDSIRKEGLNSGEGVALVSNKYDELLKEDFEEDLKEEKDTKKWSVASTIAPIYYNSFNTKGSPLDLQFKDSPKTGSKSVAYGVKVGYKLNDKLTLQAGVSKIDVGYKIGNVFINPTQQYQVRLTNVNYANTNTAAILNVNAENFLSDALIETNATTGFTGELNQSFGYIEIPMELKYSITDTSKKLGVNLIGGVSTLLLNKNDVFVTTSEFSSSLGEANNLNKVNFSGNIGVDIDYKINKRIYINVAPMLKIHTKTFSNNDNNFEPYLFGVYTGINYRF